MFADFSIKRTLSFSDYLLTVTCDNEVESLFIDGKQEKELEAHDQWKVEKTVTIPESSTVIAIQCTDYDGDPGILASVESSDGTILLVSDNSWTCSPTFERGWESVGFVESPKWQAATELNNDTNIIKNSEKSVQWIWTNRYTWPENIDTTVYCRGILGNNEGKNSAYS